MKGILVHAGLLLAALVGAYVTWTREEADARQREAVTVWRERVEDIDSVIYTREGTALTLLRRGAADTAYLWGILRSPSTEGEAATAAEFPVGAHGEEVLQRLAILTALRDLGTLSDSSKAEYGLVDPAGRLTVAFRDGARELRVGGNAFGTGHGYAVDPASGRGYVLSADVVRRLATGPSALQLTEVHAFDPGDVATATVRAGASAITTWRRPGATPTAGSWSLDSAAGPDPAVSDLMEHLGRLYVVSYASDADTSGLELRLRAEYRDTRGRPLGHLELYRRPGDPARGRYDYYLRTERTRILARAVQLPAERVDDALAAVFPPSPGAARGG